MGNNIDNIEDGGINVAISWFLHNACGSNVELAAISNVCRGWRDVSTRTIASEAAALAAVADSPSDRQLSTRRPLSCVRRMLLTEMAREMIARQHQLKASPSNSNPSNAGSASAGANFCLAWFAPSGIQTLSVPLDDDAASEVEDDDDGPRSKRRGRKAKSGRSVTCCPEWRGYRHATEVLTPFGYSTDFIMVSWCIMYCS